MFRSAKIVRSGLGLCLVMGMLATLPAKEIQPGAKPAPPSAAVESWAMLIQMMDRLRNAVARKDFSLIHLEDRVASAAVSTLLKPLVNAWTPNAAAQKSGWMKFVQDISALHSAADAAEAETCATLFKQVDADFRKLQEGSDPAVIKAARELAERYTCPMHSDVIGGKGDTCGQCGMELDQLVVLVPSQAATQHAVRATITTDAPLEAGKPAHAILQLRRTDGEPVTPAELIETHTRKIHLLVVDGSLMDYHHEHPQPTDTPGDYAFDFTPTKPGPYLAWADLRPLPMGLQEYEKAIIAGTGTAEPIGNKEPRLKGDAGGLHFELILAQPQVKAGEPVLAKLRVTKPDGSGFDRLEPVMEAFAHLVGFNEDKETVLHMHPSGAPLKNGNERGGPELDFKIYASKPGFVRLFAQVQVDGRPVFVPFQLEVLPR